MQELCPDRKRFVEASKVAAAQIIQTASDQRRLVETTAKQLASVDALQPA